MRFNRQNAFVALGSLLILLAMPMRSVHAQLAVIDVSSLRSLYSRFSCWPQQLAELERSCYRRRRSTSR